MCQARVQDQENLQSTQQQMLTAFTVRGAALHVCEAATIVGETAAE